MWDEFKAWYPLSDKQREHFIRQGLIALDTNVLLDFYRMNAEARKDLLSLLRQLEQRLWVPHQVALEFHRNRFNVIHDQEEIIDKTRKAISDSAGKLREAVNQMRDHPVIDRRALADTIDSAFAQVNAYVDEACKEPVLSIDAARNSDPVLDAVTELLNGRVGKAYDADRMMKVSAEAKKRIQDKRPPGYADAKKDENKQIGDYVIWRQLMDEADRRKLATLLITNDQKEDWYSRFHGITIGPRPELVEEMLAEAGVSFHAQTLALFIKTASPGLKSQVKQTTLSEVKRLDDERRAASSGQVIFDDSRRSQLFKDSSINSNDNPESEVTRLEVIRDDALHLVRRLEDTLEAYRATEATASGDADDPRSYVRALQAQLENAQASLAEIDARLQSIQRTFIRND